jgi:hypothetical protein
MVKYGCQTTDDIKINGLLLISNKVSLQLMCKICNLLPFNHRNLTCVKLKTAQRYQTQERGNT